MGARLVWPLVSTGGSAWPFALPFVSLPVRLRVPVVIVVESDDANAEPFVEA